MWKNRKTYQALFVIILVALITVVSAVTENARDYNIDLTFSEDDISQVEFTESQSYVKMIGKGLNIPLKSFYYDINDNKIEHYYISHHYYNNYTISVCSEINMPINIKYLKI